MQHQGGGLTSRSPQAAQLTHLPYEGGEGEGRKGTGRDWDRLGFKGRRKYLVERPTMRCNGHPPVGLEEECHGLTQGYQGGCMASTTGYPTMHMHHGVRSREITPEAIARRESQTRASPWDSFQAMPRMVCTPA